MRNPIERKKLDRLKDNLYRILQKKNRRNKPGFPPCFRTYMLVKKRKIEIFICACRSLSSSDQILAPLGQ